jgi:hypothetical protein
MNSLLQVVKLNGATQVIASADYWTNFLFLFLLRTIFSEKKRSE